MKLYSFGVLLGVVYAAYAADDSVCNAMSFDSDSFVCVCDEDHCDYIFDVVLPEEGSFTRYVSSRDSARFQILEGVEEELPTGNTTLIIDHQLAYQTLFGFGGTFTDSAGINIVAMGEVLQEKIMRSYFGGDGIDYKICRIPIAGTDCSIRPYSYDDVDGDVDLEFFELQEEDFVYKLPLIQRAIELSNHQLRFLGSPWSPPAWMKENKMVNESGGLLPGMEDPYARYLVRFVEEYEKELNTTLWGITPQNEPMTGFGENYPWNTCAFSAEDMRDFIRDYLGPTLDEAGLRRLMLLILDHNRQYLPDYPAVTLEDPRASRYVDGIAVHWYTDQWDPASLLETTHEMFPEAFLLYTEATEGWYANADERVVLGSWQRAENYAANIIEDLNSHVRGWIDWCFALDLMGGPSWADNYVDSAIIVDPENGVFYKQPMYYALGHFSKFLTDGAERLYSNVEGDTDAIKAAAFHDPLSDDVVIILNTDTSPQDVSILAHSGSYINIRMEPKSIETILFA